MCGRFTLTLGYQELLSYFQLDAGFALAPRFNIAPVQQVAAVREAEGRRHLVALRWGLIPFWARDAKIAYRTINARSETASTSPAFRAAFRGRRCLIPASGFFEWDKQGGSRQPYYIQRVDGQPLALAGLWEHWQNPAGQEVIESCTILTTESAGPVARLHDRMPVILEPADFALWLDPDEHGVERLRKLLQPAAQGTLTLYPVSRFVNKASNEGAECVKRLVSSAVSRDA